ncbi:hypothetical protein [Ralstonia sp. SET104]|uniref:hypothetical protein n=1 Tax=Ralstonia sp. SET104 TaxID=2448774 RepID=UPI000F5604F1|nr:hypothetical protein [Ralstonia sp. SET104]GCB02427.1 hypothetical protein PSUB009319_00580 [Ralstonia sp. SET104]
MPHYVNAPRGSAAFREQFNAIRETFISRFAQLVAAERVERFRVCDCEGRPVDWIWNNETFKYEGQVGTATDAQRYLEAMFNQGMYVACIVVDSTDGAEMWLTAWETPGDAPPWPPGITGRNELIHDGVQIASPLHQVPRQ